MTEHGSSAGALAWPNASPRSEDADTTDVGVTPAPPTRGYTLDAYADELAVPRAFLEGIGVSEIASHNRTDGPAVQFAYRGLDGDDLAVRYRLSAEGAMAWRRGDTNHPYGLDRLAEARTRDQLVLVPNEAQCHVLWQHGVPALGLIGGWDERFAELLTDIEETYYLDTAANKGLFEGLATSSIAERVHRIGFAASDISDPVALHRSGRFDELWNAAVERAQPLVTPRRRSEKHAWALCESIATSPSVLDAAYATLRDAGLAGEERAAKLLFLVLTSHVLDTPISAIVKGSSSAGKSNLVKRVLALCSAPDYLELTAMSNKFLTRLSEDLAHRHLVLYEAVPMANKTLSYLTRTLLSEGRIAYSALVPGRKGEWKAEHLKPVSSIDVYEHAQQILADPQRRARLDRTGTFALRGRVRCVHCGSAMNGRSSNGSRYRYYECSRRARLGKEACPLSRSVPATELEASVREAIADALSHPRRLLAELRRASGSKATTSKVASLQKQLDGVRVQRSRLLDLYVDGAIAKPEFDKRASTLDDRTTRLEAELAVLPTSTAPPDLALIERGLPAAARAIRLWVTQADAEFFDLALRSLDLSVLASRDAVSVEGSVPIGGGEDPGPLRAAFRAI